jgi:hypothetical protein
MSNCPWRINPVNLSARELLPDEKAWFGNMINNYKIKPKSLAKNMD